MYVLTVDLVKLMLVILQSYMFLVEKYMLLLINSLINVTDKILVLSAFFAYVIGLLNRAKEVLSSFLVFSMYFNEMFPCLVFITKNLVF